MAHNEHNRSKQSSGSFALIILGALLLFIAPTIHGDTPDLGTASLVFGLIIGGIGFYLRFVRKVGRKWIELGFLNRKKKQPESDEYKKIKTTEEIINEQQETESQNLQTEISEKTTHLASIIEKLELTKKEYQGVISQTMSSKKQLLDIKKQIKSAYSDFDLAPKQEEHQRILVEIKQSNDELSKIKKELEYINPKKLDFQKVNEELEQRKKELEIIKKQIQTSKSTIKKDGDNSKQIVESASQVIATTKKKLDNTLKELDMMKQILEKEKKSHNETKKKLNQQK